MSETTKLFWFKIYSWGIFLFIFIYLLLRALWVEPLHDESATFLHFIELEKIYGEGVILDANNHLFNSWLGSIIHHFFGDHLFLIRFPNVLCFALYFYGVYKLVKSIKIVYFKIVLLTAMVTVAYMDDYFAYTRGYGMAISFFIWMLIYAHKWVQENTIKNAALLYLFTLLAVFSSLIFMVSGCLAMAIVGIIHLQHLLKWTWKKQVPLFALHLLFLTGMSPFVYFSYNLKMGGALYYGSLKGFWEVTGKTLTQYVLFYDADWQKWIWISLISAFAILLIYLFVKKGFWNQLKEKVSVFGYFFFGNILAIFILAKFMEVNYPEDRAGMYFIPLVILIFGFSILKTSFTKSLVFLLLFFPISFITTLNFNTSIFTADERFSDELFSSLEKEIDSETSFAVYQTMILNYSMHERNANRTKFQANIFNSFSPLYDIIVNKEVLLKNAHLLDYKLIHHDQLSGISAYKRKFPLRREILTTYEIPLLTSSDEYINLLVMNFSDTLRGNDMLLKIQGEFEMEKKFRDVKFVISTFDKEDLPVRYEYYDQRWINGLTQLIFPININHVFQQLSPLETELRLYIWNPQHSKVSFRNGKTHFYKLIN